MEIALCNVTVFGSESVLLLPGVTAALWETVDCPALPLLCGLCDALDRQIPASVNPNGLNASVWSYFHHVFFHQQSFVPELYFFHIHSLPPYSSVWALHLLPPTDEAQPIFGAQHPDFWRRFSLILTVYIVGIKSQGGLNKPLEALQIISLAAAEALIVETTFLKQLISHSEPLLAICKRVFLATVPSANTLYFWVTVIMVLVMMFMIYAQK